MNFRFGILLAALCGLASTFNVICNFNSVTTELADKGRLTSDSLAVFVTSDDLDAQFANLPCPYLVQFAKDKQFKGAAASILVAPLIDQPYKYLIIAGLGSNSARAISFETYRRALGNVVQAVDAHSVKNLDLELPAADLFAVDPNYLIEQTVAIANITNRKFDLFVSEPSKKTRAFVLKLILNDLEIADVEQALAKGHVISSAVNQARLWIDLPSNHLTPAYLANEAQKIADSFGLKATILGNEEIKALGMGGLAAVSQGSVNECKFVILEYQCGVENAPTIALVGKGITYDSGGLSIKSTSGMLNMKYDMAGAAAVIAAMQGVAELKPAINVIGCAPLSENVISANAYRPGDIIQFYNGKTALINNTDAEGRLVLADALAYVTKNYKLDAVIDIATLTGAARVALGTFYSAIMSEDENLTDRLMQAGQKSGDYLWRLPLTDDYKPAMKNDLADLQNAGKEAYSAGTITAASFLQHFVGQTPWAHLDIAPTAFDAIGLPYYRPNTATGAGVRLFLELASSWSK